MTTKNTPPTDRPLTAGDANAPCPGGWLIKDFADGWIWTGHRIAAVAALTEGHAVHALARPATSAASEGEGAEAQREIAAQALVDHEWGGSQPGFDKKPPHWREQYMARVDVVLAALASPPSERERELEGALREAARIVDTITANFGDGGRDSERVGITRRHVISDRPRQVASLEIGQLRSARKSIHRALTAQPAGEGE